MQSTNAKNINLVSTYTHSSQSIYLIVFFSNLKQYSLINEKDINNGIINTTLFFLGFYYNSFL